MASETTAATAIAEMALAGETGDGAVLLRAERLCRDAHVAPAERRAAYRDGKARRPAEPFRHYGKRGDGATACGWLLGRRDGARPRYTASLDRVTCPVCRRILDA